MELIRTPYSDQFNRLRPDRLLENQQRFLNQYGRELSLARITDFMLDNSWEDYEYDNETYLEAMKRYVDVRS